MAHILVVCTANICRSPVAEAILCHHLEKRGLSRWTVSSAGTWAQNGRRAAHNSIHLMAERGIDITDHRSRLIEERHLQEADLILCMEWGHVEALRSEFPAYGDKVNLISKMVGEDYSINDPYGGPLEAYQSMVVELTRIIEAGLDHIIELARNNVQNGD